MLVRVNATHAVYGQPGTEVRVADDDAEAMALVRAGVLTRVHEPQEPE